MKKLLLVLLISAAFVPAFSFAGGLKPHLKKTVIYILQKQIDSKFGVTPKHVLVEDVLLVRSNKGSSKYEGEARIRVYGSEMNLPVVVYSDGKTVILNASGRYMYPIYKRIKNEQEVAVMSSFIKEMAKEHPNMATPAGPDSLMRTPVGAAGTGAGHPN